MVTRYKTLLAFLIIASLKVEVHVTPPGLKNVFQRRSFFNPSPFNRLIKLRTKFTRYLRNFDIFIYIYIFLNFHADNSKKKKFTFAVQSEKSSVKFQFCLKNLKKKKIITVTREILSLKKKEKGKEYFYPNLILLTRTRLFSFFFKRFDKRFPLCETQLTVEFTC